MPQSPICNLKGEWISADRGLRFDTSLLWLNDKQLKTVHWEVPVGQAEAEMSFSVVHVLARLTCTSTEFRTN